MIVGLFGGTFDPVHTEHTSMCSAAIKFLQLDRLIVLPAGVPPHKPGAQSVLRRADKEHRLKMAQLAYSNMDKVVVDSYEIDREGESYTHLTVKHFADKYPQAKLFFIMGADSLISFFDWKHPQEILKNCTLAVCHRGGIAREDVLSAADKLKDNVTLFPYSGSKLSASKLRIKLQFDLYDGGLDDNVYKYIKQHNLYSGYRELTSKVRTFMSDRRYKHTAGTAYLAVELAKQQSYSADKAFIAATLHDITKEINEEELAALGYKERTDLPHPVRHAFSGSFFAQRMFNIRDSEILDAIKYHTTGRANMTLAEKILFVADFLEPTRKAEGNAELRELAATDFDRGFKACLDRQYKHLLNSGKEISPLTASAYSYYCKDKV